MSQTNPIVRNATSVRSKRNKLLVAENEHSGHKDRLIRRIMAHDLEKVALAPRGIVESDSVRFTGAFVYFRFNFHVNRLKIRWLGGRSQEHDGSSIPRRIVLVPFNLTIANPPPPSAALVNDDF